MEILKTKGIILRKKNTGDADLYVTIFTEDYGKIDATAFGIRKSKRKEMFSLNPLSVSEILLVKNREFYNIKESTTINSYKNLRKNIEKLEVSLYILDSVNKIFDISYEKSEFYEKLVEILDFIDNLRQEELSRGYKYYIILTFLRRIMIDQGIYDRNEIKMALGEKNYRDFLEIAALNSSGEYGEYEIELKKIVNIFQNYINDNLQVRLNINNFIMEDF